MRAAVAKMWIVTCDNAYPADLPVMSSCGVITPDGEWAVRAPLLGEQYCAHAIEIP